MINNLDYCTNHLIKCKLCQGDFWTYAGHLHELMHPDIRGTFIQDRRRTKSNESYEKVKICKDTLVF